MHRVARTATVGPVRNTLSSNTVLCPGVEEPLTNVHLSVALKFSLLMFFGLFVSDTHGKAERQREGERDRNEFMLQRPTHYFP